MSKIVIFDNELIDYVDKNKFSSQIDNNSIINLNIVDSLFLNNINNSSVFLFLSVDLFFISLDFLNFVKNNIILIKNINFNVILINKNDESNDLVINWFNNISKKYNFKFEIINQISENVFVKKVNDILVSIFEESDLLNKKELNNNDNNSQSKKNNSIEIYTDGACSGNPGAGGWGAVLLCGNEKKEISGFDLETTNNKMELTAVIKALSLLKYKCNVELYSDSAYVVNAIKLGWLENWKNNNWKGSDKKSVKNIELWQELDNLLNIHNVNFNKVKGHSDNELNNRCDELATGEIAKHLNI